MEPISTTGGPNRRDGDGIPAMLGISHRTAAVDVRGRLTIAADDRSRALESLSRATGVRECAVLATCNRTEIYAVTDGGDTEPLLRWFCQWHGLSETVLRPYVRQRNGRDAVAHLMRVASGLESAVIGETQIVAQIKDAFLPSGEVHGAGSVLHRLTDHALAVAKRVRSETGVGRCPVSVAGVAADAVGRLLGDLPDARILVIGAGENAALVLKHLRAKGAVRLVVANRTLTRARRLAAEHGAEAYPLSAVEDLLAEVDAVVATSGAPQALIDAPLIARARARRSGAPLLLIDLAVPPDIAPDAADFPDVHLYSVDALAALSRANLAHRLDAVREADRLIDDGSDRFMDWLAARSAAPTITALRRQADDFRRDALEKARRELRRGRPAEEVVAYLAHHLTQRLLHEPSLALRSADSERREILQGAVAELFALEDAAMESTDTGPATATRP